jgi:hypothetical protein
VAADCEDADARLGKASGLCADLKMICQQNGLIQYDLISRLPVCTLWLYAMHVWPVIDAGGMEFRTMCSGAGESQSPSQGVRSMETVNNQSPSPRPHSSAKISTLGRWSLAGRIEFILGRLCCLWQTEVLRRNPRPQYPRKITCFAWCGSLR